MKSIKRGRGPSAMNAAGAAFAVIFGIIWVFGAISMGAPAFFPLFGLCFIGIAVFQIVYNYRNATGKNRYSEYDIVDETEETDPFQERFGNAGKRTDGETKERGSFCPYCGAAVEHEHRFCKQCGREL